MQCKEHRRPNAWPRFLAPGGRLNPHERLREAPIREEALGGRNAIERMMAEGALSSNLKSRGGQSFRVPWGQVPWAQTSKIKYSPTSSWHVPLSRELSGSFGLCDGLTGREELLIRDSLCRRMRREDVQRIRVWRGGVRPPVLGRVEKSLAVNRLEVSYATSLSRS